MQPSRLGKIRLVLFLLVGVASVFMLAGADDKGRDRPKKARLEWGTYQILWSRHYDKQIKQELDKFASKPQYIMFYRDLLRGFPSYPAKCIRDYGATPIVSLELWSWHGRRSGAFLPLIRKGDYDDFFRQWALDAKADGRRTLLRFGFEFNGDWFSWSGDPEAFVEAWRRAHDIFREVGTKNVEWVWAPNVVSCPNTPNNNMHRYYPGDAYVDWIGVDGYNFGDHHDQWHRWETFDEVYAKTLSEFERLYPNKPVMISEFGCATDDTDRRPTWIREAYQSIKKRPHIKAVVWFNHDKRREGEPNWRIDATSGSLEAFNQTFAAPPPK